MFNYVYEKRGKYAHDKHTQTHTRTYVCQLIVFQYFFSRNCAFLCIDTYVVYENIQRLRRGL